jgi:hypothetical protein
VDGAALDGERGQPARASLIQQQRLPNARVAHVHHKRLETLRVSHTAYSHDDGVQIFFADPETSAAAPPQASSKPCRIV